MKTIGERITHLRKSRNMTQRALMDTLDFNNLSRIEKDESLPGLDIIVALADYFEVSTDWILKGNDFNDDVNLHQNEVLKNSQPASSDSVNANIKIEDIDLVRKLLLLNERQKGIIEGRIDVLLEAADCKQISSILTSGEEAATDETA